MKAIPNIILSAGVGLAAIHSCFAASSIFNFAGGGDLWVPESDGTARIEVRRSGDTSSTAQIDYATVQGTAKPAVDYIAASGTLIFAPGESSKSFTIAVLDNGRVDGERKVSLGLTNPVGATLGDAHTAILNISDNEIAVRVDPTFRTLIEGGDPRLTRVEVEAMALQADGRLLIGGSFTSVNGAKRPGLARLHADGSVDEAFNPLSRSVGVVRAIVVQLNGNIVVGGSSGIGRLRPDWSVDATFNAEFIAWTKKLVLQPDGKILVQGNGALTRLKTDGSSDASFSYSGGNCVVEAVAVQPDGKLIIGGIDCVPGKPQVGLARLNADGSPDPSFKGRIEYQENYPYVNSILIQTNGQIVIRGNFDTVNGTPRTQIARLNADGSLDSSFRGPERFCCFAELLAVQPDGKVVFSEVPFGPHPLRRLNPDGSLDSAFRGPRSVGPVALQPDGMVIVADYGKVLRLYGEPSGVTGFGFSDNWEFVPEWGGFLPFGSFGRTLQRVTLALDSKLEFTVARLGGTTGTAHVDYATRDGTAQAGVDYLPQKGTLTFGPLEITKAVSVSILGNRLTQRDKAFTLVLTNASNGGLLNDPSEAPVTIVPQQFLTIHYPNPSVGGPIRLALAPTEPGVSYRVHGIENLANSWEWAYGQQKVATGDTLDFEDATATHAGQRFYQAERLGR